ncbi:8-amino-7-oxononanoate synthase [Sphingomonas tabacisoli]|uniref:8-amino-7-oxononanoate synthase n=1 Tax=Sphingomonas tabacisoli TaxID=2249466 RepID=A0ABW4I6C1_9SPHN
MLSRYSDHLEILASEHRRRALQPRGGVDFSSNDYLAMAHAPAMREAVSAALTRGVSIGSGGSRLLRGNDPEHEALEREAAAFYGSEAALFLSSGYVANSALLSTLPQREDHIFYDALVHASAHEGMRLARCGRTEVPHNDAGAFEDAIVRWRGEGRRRRPWIVVESLYSMDGDQAPLDALADIAARHEAFLVIDEAHATGVFGPRGRGLAAALQGRENVIVLRTLGKALGCEGALICCAAVLRDFLVNRARGFIFSTAPSPLMAAAARAAIGLVAASDDRRAELRALCTHAERRLARHGAVATGSQILPLVLGNDARTMAIAWRLQAAGYDVRGIRPPTVAPGTSRLRIALTLNVTTADIDGLDKALERALA